jgi:hypothetical protein
MDDELFKKLTESIQQAGAIRRGDLEPGRLFVLSPPEPEGRHEVAWGESANPRSGTPSPHVRSPKGGISAPHLHRR